MKPCRLTDLYCLAALFCYAPWVLSCTREIVLDAGESPEVVVECVLTNDRQQVLYLSLTKGASATEAAAVRDADISLKDLTADKDCGTFSSSEKGRWVLNYRPISGHQYHLEVKIPGHDAISANQTMPSSVAVNISRGWSPSASSSMDYPEHPKYGYDTGSFYSITLLPDYTWIYGLDYDEESMSLVVAEEVCTDFTGVDNFNLNGRLYEPLISPESDNAWMYARNLISCDGWALYPHLIGVSLHWRFLRLQKSKIPPEKLEEEFMIAGNFSGEYFRAHGGTPDPSQGRLVFSSVSEDYDKYLQEAIYYHRQQSSDDLSSIFVRENIFTNIQGGVGIFGAQCVVPVSWNKDESPVNPVMRKGYY